MINQTQEEKITSRKRHQPTAETPRLFTLNTVCYQLYTRCMETPTRTEITTMITEDIIVIAIDLQASAIFNFRHG